MFIVDRSFPAKKYLREMLKTFPDFDRDMEQLLGQPSVAMSTRNIFKNPETYNGTRAVEFIFSKLHKPSNGTRIARKLESIVGVAQKGDGETHPDQFTGELQCQQRPAFMYLILSTINAGGDFYFSRKFKEITARGTTFYLSRNFDPAKRTILFLHGLGIGPYPYIFLLNHLEDAGYNLVIPVVNFVSNNMFNIEPFSVENIRISIDHLLDTLGVPKVDVITNSFGSTLYLQLVVFGFSRADRVVLTDIVSLPITMDKMIQATTTSYDWGSLYLNNKHVIGFGMPETQYVGRRTVNTYFDLLVVWKLLDRSKTMFIVSKDDCYIDGPRLHDWLVESGFNSKLHAIAHARVAIREVVWKDILAFLPSPAQLA
jgi:pimeloyl-ACP methyl ester carboxylesterase